MELWEEPDDVHGRFDDLGLDIDLLHKVFERAHAEVQTCTDFAPPIFPGLTRWARTNEFLREELKAHGWTYLNKRNVPLTVNPTGEFQMVATSGDPFTGSADGTPSPRNPKGIVTSTLVEESQMALFDKPVTPGQDTTEPGADEARSFWILLYRSCVHKDGDTVRIKLRAELSLPDGISSDRRIYSWAERILLPELDLGEPSGGVLGLEGDTPDDPIDVSVTMR